MSMRTKKLPAGGPIEDAAQIVDAGRAIDFEPELRELQ
jgi:hypothetical protein